MMKKKIFSFSFIFPCCFQCRENFDCFQREGEDLKWKMLMVKTIKKYR